MGPPTAPTKAAAAAKQPSTSKLKPLDHYIVQLNEGFPLAAARAEHTTKVGQWCTETRGSSTASSITWRYNNDKLKLYVYVGIFNPEVVAKIKADTRVVKAVNVDAPVQSTMIKKGAGSGFEKRSAAHWGLSKISPDVSGSKEFWQCPVSKGEGVTIYVVEKGQFSIDSKQDPEFAGHTVRTISLDGSKPVKYKEDDHGVIISRLATGSKSGTAPSANLVNVTTSTISMQPGMEGLDHEQSVQYAHGYIGYIKLITLAIKDMDFDLEVEELKAVINCSWVTYEKPDKKGALSILKDFFEKISEFIPVVVASGNEGLDIDKLVCIPATCSGTITVGSCDYNGYESKFSNCGNCVDILAPGEQIETGSKKIEFKDGTSLASPLVAGVIACMISEAKRKNEPGLTAAKIKKKLLANADIKGGIKYVTARFTK
ncbi:hypothetical protein B7494_g8002 [Chlorociboria aeruginascens]|nr:hypothetical protein B7494_g8002 [Chlorociboria aeruginascens]